jgi:hypothetical protein
MRTRVGVNINGEDDAQATISEPGKLSQTCLDRWTKNDQGGTGLAGRIMRATHGYGLRVELRIK